MQNDPELNGKYMGTITHDFVKISDILKEASYQIRKRGFSDYPVFPIAKIDQPIGQLLMKENTLEMEWNYYISYLEEFVERGLVENVDVFTNAFKDADEYCCLFVIDENFTNFVFIPFPED